MLLSAGTETPICRKLRVFCAAVFNSRLSPLETVLWLDQPSHKVQMPPSFPGTMLLAYYSLEYIFYLSISRTTFKLPVIA